MLITLVSQYMYINNDVINMTPIFEVNCVKIHVIYIYILASFPGLSASFSGHTKQNRRPGIQVGHVIPG